MDINRHNYEQYFLLYIDNELSAADRKAVEVFAQSQPDLAMELEQWKQSRLVPDEELIFSGKAALLKPETGGSLDLDAGNCESYFILYADEELDNAQKAAVEEFVYREPRFQASFELIQQLKLVADPALVFPDKQSLYRSEEKERPLPLWWKWAAAAMILLVAGISWLTLNNKNSTGHEPGLAIRQPANSGQAVSAGHKSNEDKTAIGQKTQINPVAVKTSEGEKSTEPVKAAIRPERTLIARTQGRERQKPPSNKGNNTALAQAHPEQSPLEPATSLTLRQARPQNLSTPGTETKLGIAIRARQPAAERVVLTDQPDPRLSPLPDENDHLASFAAQRDDRVEILNTSVDRKNTLRGFFRKASRLIAKKNNSGDENRKGILIGGFEIAVK